MYAIVKTGGKQYRVAVGDKVVVEKLPAEVGETVELSAICIVDGDQVQADPAVAAQTKVEAEVLDQFRGEKQLVFKFKKRKNYKKMRGHRQYLTKLRVVAIGDEKFTPKKAAPAAEAQAEEAPAEEAVATEE